MHYKILQVYQRLKSHTEVCFESTNTDKERVSLQVRQAVEDRCIVQVITFNQEAVVEVNCVKHIRNSGFDHPPSMGCHPTVRWTATVTSDSHRTSRGHRAGSFAVNGGHHGKMRNYLFGAKTLQQKCPIQFHGRLYFYEKFCFE